jgi:L-fuculose-phosphate aldolase
VKYLGFYLDVKLDTFQKEPSTRAVVIKNHGVVTIDKDIHQARAVVEALEEWAKIITISEIFGGAKDYLS